MLKKTDPVERILLRHNKINPAVLEEVKNNNLHDGKYLGKTLADHGYIHVQSLLETLSKELSVDYLQGKDFPTESLPVEGLEISEAFLKEKVIFPIKLEGNHLTIAVFDPFDRYTIENLKISTGKEIHIVVCSEQDILEAVEKYYGEGGSTMDRMVEKVGDDEVNTLDSDIDSAEHIRDMASEAPVIKLVNHIIAEAIEKRASDIHLEPFSEELILRYRIDGILHAFEAPTQKVVCGNRHPS